MISFEGWSVNNTYGWVIILNYWLIPNNEIKAIQLESSSVKQKGQTNILYSDFSLLFDSLSVKAFLWCKSVSLFSALMLSKLSQELCSNKKYLLDVFSQLLVNLTDVISPAKNLAKAFFTLFDHSYYKPHSPIHKNAFLNAQVLFCLYTHTHTDRQDTQPLPWRQPHPIPQTWLDVY